MSLNKKEEEGWNVIRKNAQPGIWWEKKRKATSTGWRRSSLPVGYGNIDNWGSLFPCKARLHFSSLLTVVKWGEPLLLKNVLPFILCFLASHFSYPSFSDNKWLLSLFLISFCPSFHPFPSFSLLWYLFELFFSYFTLLCYPYSSFVPTVCSF